MAAETLLGQLMPLNYALQDLTKACIHVKFPEFDHCTVILQGAILDRKYILMY